MITERGSGILLHITSLPSPYGIGDLGPAAYQFSDVLKKMKQHYWQILPINPTDPIAGNSPYSSPSAFAGNPLFISPDMLISEGLLSPSDVRGQPFSEDKVDYEAAAKYKTKLLDRAYEQFKTYKPEESKKDGKKKEFERFCSENASWLDDYALFAALKKRFTDGTWNAWPTDLRDRVPEAMRAWRERLADHVNKEKFVQYVFFTQWHLLKSYCNKSKIKIIGDVPIYVTYDSCDVWAHTNFFSLDEEKRPTHVSGVPPDYFSKTGQRWGNPVYRWEALKENGYGWWLQRIEHNLNLFDLVRIDHFRGLVAYWRIPVHEKTAVNGEWIEAPVYDFLNTVMKRFPKLPLIAEDLGYITDDVRAVIKHFDLPGMKVLMFAFDEDFAKNPYIPHEHVKNCVVYTGTHDNNTVKGWFRQELDEMGKKRLSAYLGHPVKEDKVHWDLIQLALSSVANIAIVPMQDVLGLDEMARLNYPSTAHGNWEWRMRSAQITPSIHEKLKDLAGTYGREWFWNDAPAQ